MIKKLKVGEVNIAGVAGYQIEGLYRDCPDSMYEVVVHAAVFRDKARAERFLAKVQSKPSWEYSWEYWGKPVGYIRSSIDACQGAVAPFSVI